MPYFFSSFMFLLFSFYNNFNSTLFKLFLVNVLSLSLYILLLSLSLSFAIVLFFYSENKVSFISRGILSKCSLSLADRERRYIRLNVSSRESRRSRSLSLLLMQVPWGESQSPGWIQCQTKRNNIPVWILLLSFSIILNELVIQQTDYISIYTTCKPLIYLFIFFFYLNVKLRLIYSFLGHSMSVDSVMTPTPSDFAETWHK